MQIDVKFFGLAIYHKPGGERIITYSGRYCEPEERIITWKDNWYLYFVLDLGKSTKKPICIWTNNYRTKYTVNKAIKICENAGHAIIVSKSDKKYPNAVKIMAKLKMNFFGMDDVPIKHLTKNEWEGRYKQLETKNNIDVC